MRKPRFYYEANFYHVMVQGDEKKYIFQSYKNKQKYLYYLKRNAFRNDIEIIAYCIMDNHAHVLLFCPEIARISKMMSESNTSFGIYYSKERKNIGHVFRERYRSESIYTKEHLINCIKYIHNNPVKAEICENPEQYGFSSYRYFDKLSDIIKEKINLSDEEIKNILEDSSTITRFLDDEYSKDDINLAYEEIKKEINYDENDDNSIGQMFLKLKEQCRINDTEIANLLNMKRTTMYSKLKRIGVKKGVI